MKKIIYTGIIIILLTSTITFAFMFKNSVEENKRLKEETKTLNNKTDDLEKDYSTSSNDSKDKEVNNTIEENNNQEYNRLIEISLEEFEEKIESKESFALIVTQTFCGHCTRFKPVLNEFLEENNLFIYEVNYQNFTAEQKTQFKEKINVGGTPTIVFVENGSEIDTSKRLVGEVSKEKLKERFIETGYIK